MDRIDITGLKFETGIGTYDWEHGILQTVYIDLSLQVDTHAAGRSDQLSDAVDYHAIAQQIQALLKGTHFQLIEAMAEAIADQILKIEEIEGLELTVEKPGALTNARSVSVTINRPRPESV